MTMMNERATRSVTQLEEYRYRQVRVRQATTREYLNGIVQRVGPEAPVAGAGILVMPDGNISLAAFNLEGEQLEPAISAMRRLIERMESFMPCTFAGRRPPAAEVALATTATDILLEPALAAQALVIHVVIYSPLGF